MVSFIPGGSIHSIQINMTTEDGSESVIVHSSELSESHPSTGVGVAHFSTDSTGGMLAP